MADVIMCGGTPTPDDLAKVQEFAAALSLPTKHLQNLAMLEMMTPDPEVEAALAQHRLDPEPWLFISDQVFGEFRSDHDRGYHDVSGTYWALSPRPEFCQHKECYGS